MKQRLLKTMALGLLMVGSVNAWAGDFIDDAATIKVAGTDVSPNAGDKKTLTFTPTGTDAKVEFTFTSKTITPGQIFGLVEYSSNGGTFNKTRMMKMTINDNEYEEKSAGSVLSFTLGNGNKVAICSYLQNANDTESKQFVKYYTDNVDETSYTVTAVTAYVGVATANTETTVTRMGVYTLGEILEFYPELKTKNWQINNSYRLLNDASSLGINNSKTNNGTDNGLIETKNAAITTLAGCKLFCKAVDFAKIPDNYRYYWFRFLQPSDEASREDLFAGMNENAVLMLSFGTGSNPHSMPYLPTMHKKLIDFDRGMQNTTFVDGIAPSSAVTVDGKTLGKNATANWATFSRELKAGYNSCMMPFKKFANASDIPAGLTFYKIGSYGDGKITFTQMSSSDLTASNAFTNGSDSWTPIIIKAENAGVYTFVGRDGMADLSGYKAKKVGNSGDEPNAIYWVGSYNKEVPTGDYASTTNYGITADGKKFAPMGAATKVSYFRAFIADNRSGGARELTPVFGDSDVTGVSQIENEGMRMNNSYFNLSGQRVAQPTKGLYIVNGKKVIIK